jgi:predicted alpha/beta superfamily hydrolase
MKLSSFFYATRLIGIPLCIMVSFISSSGQSRYSTAKPDIRDYTIHSKILGQDRKYSIYRPPVLPEYAEAVSPIIYVIDGEWVSYYFCAMINNWCERFPDHPPITVVGIENEPSMISPTGQFNLIGRNKDLTPFVARDSSIFTTSGGAEEFLQYIREELMPVVERGYAKKPYRVVAGCSLGGLLVMHSFLQHADMFNAFIASSPAMWMDGSIYMKTAEEIINKATSRNSRLFFSAGNESARLVNDAIKFDSLLRRKNLQGLSYKFAYYPTEGHATLRTLHDGLDYVFHNILPELETKPSEISYALIEKYYEELSPIYGYKMKPPESKINSLGYRFLLTDVDKALELFKRNVENYPESANVYDSYAEAMLKKGDKKNAIINYEKAFQMDPTNTAARDIANKLKSEQ